MRLVARHVMLLGLVAAVGACTASETATIVSEPTGASVAINGQTVGKTPMEYDFAFPEDYTQYSVRVSKSGYHSNSTSVSLNRLKKSGRLSLNLESQNVAATITSEPSEVNVKIAGQEIGTTPVRHIFNFANRSSRYRITGSKEGYHDGAAEVTEEKLKRSSQVKLTLESQNKSILISSVPVRASVRVGDKRLGDREVGRTPTEHTFNFADRDQRYMLTVSKPGFFDHVIFLTEHSHELDAGEIDIVLEEDPAWISTSESEATNRWLRIPVNPVIDHAGAWQRVIDSVTTVYTSLEQLDQVSGYIRSAPRFRQFDKGPDGPYYVRTQFVGSVSSTEPLTYKIKVISKTRLEAEPDENWRDFGRVFAEDAQLVEELLNRLGLK